LATAVSAIERPLRLVRFRLGQLRIVHGVVAVVALALLVRVLVVILTPHFVPQTDSAAYDRTAVSLAQHGRFPASDFTAGPAAFRPPAFPLALAAVYKVVGVSSASTRWEAGRLLEAVLGAAAVALVAVIALRLWGRRAGLLAGLIAAVYPPLVLVGSSLMTEPLFIALLLAAVLAALIARDSRHRRRWEVLTGLLVGLGALTRGNGIALLVPICFLVWSHRPRLSWRSAFSPLIVIAATAMTLTPWLVRNAREFHQPVLTTETGFAVAGTYSHAAAHDREFTALWLPPATQTEQVLRSHPGLNEAALSNRLTSLGVSYAEGHPGYVAQVLWWSSLRLLDLSGIHYERWLVSFEAYPLQLAVVSVYAFWILAVLGLLGALTSSARRAPLALWACPVVVCLITLPIQGSTRYRSPADPFIVMLAVLGLLAASEAIRTRIARRARRPIQVRSPAG
jgi:4-amino-4-deoxy-L-arabinose transferase-like glycosyltransferase